MAYIEGLCKNCGSLIQVNPNQTEARCIFCWDKTDSQTAINLLTDTANRPEFPNQTISDAPPFEERMSYWRQEVGDNSPLNKTVKTKHNYDNIARKEVKEDKLSAVSRLKMMKFDLLQVPKVSTKNRILLALGLVILPLAILIVATLPKYIQATSNIASLQSKLNTIVQSELLQEGRSHTDCIAILNNDIRNLRVVVGKTPQTADLQSMAKNLYATCTEINQVAPEQVSLQVISKEKSYQVTATGAEQVEITELTSTR